MNIDALYKMVEHPSASSTASVEKLRQIKPYSAAKGEKIEDTNNIENDNSNNKDQAKQSLNSNTSSKSKKEKKEKKSKKDKDANSPNSKKEKASKDGPKQPETQIAPSMSTPKNENNSKSEKVFGPSSSAVKDNNFNSAAKASVASSNVSPLKKTTSELTEANLTQAFRSLDKTTGSLKSLADLGGGGLPAGDGLSCASSLMCASHISERNNAKIINATSPSEINGNQVVKIDFDADSEVIARPKKTTGSFNKRQMELMGNASGSKTYSAPNLIQSEDFENSDTNAKGENSASKKKTFRSSTNPALRRSDSELAEPGDDSHFNNILAPNNRRKKKRRALSRHTSNTSSKKRTRFEKSSMKNRYSSENATKDQDNDDIEVDFCTDRMKALLREHEETAAAYRMIKKKRDIIAKKLHTESKEYVKMNSLAKEVKEPDGITMQKKQEAKRKKTRSLNSPNEDEKIENIPPQEPIKSAWRGVWKTTADDIGHYGLGLQLYFELLQWLMAIFFLFAVLNTGLIYANAHGNMIDGPLASFVKTTIGNFGEMPPSIVNNSLPNKSGLFNATSQLEARQMIAERKLVVDGEEHDIKRVTTFFGVVCAFCMLAFIVWTYYYRKINLRQAIEFHDLQNVTPSDYAVHICNLPEVVFRDGKKLDHDEYTAALKSHIENVLSIAVKRYRRKAVKNMARKARAFWRRKQLDEERANGGKPLSRQNSFKRSLSNISNLLSPTKTSNKSSILDENSEAGTEERSSRRSSKKSTIDKYMTEKPVEVYYYRREDDAFDFDEMDSASLPGSWINKMPSKSGPNNL